MATLPRIDVSEGQFKLDLQRSLYTRSLRDYIPAGWRSWLVSKKYLHNWHIDAMGDHLQAVSERKIRKLVISIAPRHMKSLCTSVFWPTWAWTNRPHEQFVYASYGLHLVLRDAVWSRRLMEGRWYQERWGCRCNKENNEHAKDCNGWRFVGDQNVKSLYENDRGGRRLTASVDAGTTGEGGDILVMDDPIDIQKVHSAATRENAINYFEDVWLGRQNDAATTSCLVVIAQRTHEEDLTGHILKEHKGWEHLKLPTEYKPVVQISGIGFKDPRKTAGELLWPERFGPEQVEDAKKRPYTYAAQHTQEPTPAGGGIIKRKWMRFWRPRDSILPPVRDRDGIEYSCIEIPAKLDGMFQSWDCSFKAEAEQIRKGKDPDFVSGGCWGRKGPDAYLLDRVSARMDIVDTVQAVRTMSASWPQAIAKLIEDKANGPAAMQILRRELPGITSVTPQGSKVQRVMTAAQTDSDRDARALAMVDLFAAGNVFLPHPAHAPWVWDYVEQLCSFPTGANDDDVDMTSQALMHMQAKVWQEADAAQMEAERHNRLPPPRTTQEILRRQVRESLERERAGPSVNAQRWRR
jgi:predicted phage terminase large subunit-like protein